MKKASLFALLFLVNAMNVPGQIKFSSLSLEEAAKQAKTENKIILLMVESAECGTCNVVAIQGLSSWQCKKAIETSCIPLKVAKLPSRFTNPSNLYTFSDQFFGVLFLDTNLDILHTIGSSTTLGDFYAEQIDKALQQKNSTGPTLASLKKEYYGTNADFNTTKLLIECIRKLNMEPSQNLIDDLTQKTPLDSAASISFLQFVMKCASIVGSTTEQYLKKNFDNYNMAWYRMNLSERIAINNRIISKSRSKAIAEKDLNYAYRIASFCQTINTATPENGQRTYQYSMLQYYKGIKDTNSYVRNAITYYDPIYAKANLNDIKNSDSLARSRLYKTLPAAPVPNPGNSSGNRVSIVANSRQLFPQAEYYAGNLNDGAWSLYLYSNNPLYLSKALNWAKRANELIEKPEIMDTYGRLLYKTGNKEEAITWETKADELARRRVPSLSEYGKVVEKMKAGAAVIDP